MVVIPTQAGILKIMVLGLSPMHCVAPNRPDSYRVMNDELHIKILTSTGV